MAEKYSSLSTHPSPRYRSVPPGDSDDDCADFVVYEDIKVGGGGGSDDSESITSAGSLRSRSRARMRHVGIFWDMNSCRLPDSDTPKVRLELGWKGLLRLIELVANLPLIDYSNC
jgi:hypothetical protein